MTEIVPLQLYLFHDFEAQRDFSQNLEMIVCLLASKAITNELKYSINIMSVIVLTETSRTRKAGRRKFPHPYYRCPSNFSVFEKKLHIHSK